MRNLWNLNLHLSWIDFSEKRPIKFELSLKLNGLFEKGPMKFELTLELNRLDFYEKGPMKFELTLELNRLLWKGTYKIWTNIKVKGLMKF